jgi:hypothetical protein
MNEDYYLDKMKRLEDLTNLYAGKQESIFQQLLIVSSGILGIIVALHGTHSEHLYIHLVFVLSVVLFSLCTLSLLIVLLDHTKIVKRARLSYLDEIQKAIKSSRKVNPLTGIEKKKRTLFLEKCSLFFFVSGLLSLTSYAIFIS